MDIETIVAYFLLFCPVALLIGVAVWLAWKDKDYFD
jgi:putative copper export protein